jgi:hypothetical protein
VGQSVALRKIESGCCIEEALCPETQKIAVLKMRQELLLWYYNQIEVEDPPHHLQVLPHTLDHYHLTTSWIVVRISIMFEVVSKVVRESK